MRVILTSAVTAIALLSNGSSLAVNPHQILSVYLDKGNPKTHLNQGGNLLTSTTVSCVSDSKTCTLSLDVMDTICSNTDGIKWEIAVKVDGKEVAHVKPTSYVKDCGTGNLLGIAGVPEGDHNVELYTRVDYVGIVQQRNWAFNYTVTTP